MRRKLLVGVAVVAAALAGARWLPLPAQFSASAPPAATKAPSAESPADVKAHERFDALPARAPLGQPHGALFAAPAPPPKPPAPAPVAEAKPVPPPMPYRVAGTMVHGGVSKVVLAKGDRVLTVEEGDTLEGGYRVDGIGPEEITLVYVPLDLRERLSLASGAVAATPSAPASAGGSLPAAQLRWEGPERVQAGNTFTLALKVTSNEPLRAAPLQVSYDAQLLEAVAVRPGRFFAGDASFSYRVNPAGSIFVGASGAGSSAAADAELVILTFKPIRPSAAAEVRIASLQLQGAVGKPIAAEPVPAYRTSITP